MTYKVFKVRVRCPGVYGPGAEMLFTDTTERKIRKYYKDLGFIVDSVTVVDVYTID